MTQDIITPHTLRSPRLPFFVYAASMFAAVVWCFLLSMLDNEVPSTSDNHFARYEIAFFLMYGVPVMACILWFTRAVQKRGYTPHKALLWSIPLGCLCGTVFVLLAIGVMVVWMKFFNGQY